MACEKCVFYRRMQKNPANPPCNSCISDTSDKGYCVAVQSESEIIPVITRISDEAQARAIIRRGMSNGSHFQLLIWSTQHNAYLHT